MLLANRLKLLHSGELLRCDCSPVLRLLHILLKRLTVVIGRITVFKLLPSRIVTSLRPRLRPRLLVAVVALQDGLVELDVAGFVLVDLVLRQVIFLFIIVDQFLLFLVLGIVFYTERNLLLLLEICRGIAPTLIQFVIDILHELLQLLRDGDVISI